VLASRISSSEAPQPRAPSRIMVGRSRVRMKRAPAKRKGRARASAILEILQRTWPKATCELDFKNAYQLTVATILSAQSTDKRVNLVTPALFRTYPTPARLAKADLGELEEMVHSTGFFRQKARTLIKMAQTVMSEFAGKIPRTMEEITTLPGVARKTG